ncbi:zinc finger MYM-type protein 1-like [Olea europaea var. sylvestris]|uniref:zinc finger MYM-type protein 1-like n=1 Tax=Olea europaea var. sylvestris TaxID=158386 RepID=UPI000C1CEB22|nr:zinc finger MYM-type protein 1-like [Olea europaea var. sylvestris]
MNTLNEDEVEIQPACVNEVDDKDEEVSQSAYVVVDDKEEEVMKHACVNEVDDKKEEGCSSLNLDDPRNWKIIDQRIRDYLVERGPKRVDDISFPKDYASHEEQMLLIVRFVDDSANLPTVEEHWLEFLKVDDTTGLGLTIEFQKALIKLDLDIDDIREKGYDNGSNMSGKYKGVQRRVLEMNPRAFYTPCGAHSLNLALCDMVNCCSKAVSFFGVIHRIYTLFSSSTKRWQIFKDNVKGLTVTPLSQTRWESHVESVKPIMEQTAQIREALLDLA